MRGKKGSRFFGSNARCVISEAPVRRPRFKTEMLFEIRIACEEKGRLPVKDIAVVVRAFADFRTVLGAQTKLILTQGQTVGDLLEILSENHGGLREKLFDSAGGLGEGIDIVVNGRNIGRTGDLTRELQDGDQVFFFPPLSGG